MGEDTCYGHRNEDEFNQQAVLIIVRSGFETWRVASDLGVSEQSLVRWVDD